MFPMLHLWRQTAHSYTHLKKKIKNCATDNSQNNSEITVRTTFRLWRLQCSRMHMSLIARSTTDCSAWQKIEREHYTEKA